ncbi:MAG TPA: serine hydrolase domain-containing protein [Nakamurella sp.]|nr:serine hydrolase domain-containing protein [Nakamurella sp.]
MPKAGPRWLLYTTALATLAGCTGSITTPVGGDTIAATAAASPQPAAAAGDQVLSVLQLPFPAPSGSALPATRQRALQAALDRAVRDSTQLVGVTAAVVSASGSWTGAADVDGAGVRLVPEAMMAIASITKTVTAAEVVFLEQSGLINLDAPASTYLDNPLLQRNPTVRQLLSHTSGAPEYITPALIDTATSDPTRSWTAPQALSYATDPPGDPGSPLMNYSNSNYLLLGVLIEKITGLRYDQAVRRDLFAVDTTRMVVQDAERPVPPLAAAGLSPEGLPDAVPDGIFVPDRSLATAAGAAGGIAADAATLAGWGYRLYGGRILPSARTVELATEVAPDYGLGTEIFEQPWGPRGGVIGHGGRTSGYVTVLSVTPAEQLSVAVLGVGPGGPIDVIAKRLAAALRS